MISNPTPKLTSRIRSIRSVFGRNRTGTGCEKIDRNRNRNRISGRTLFFYKIKWSLKIRVKWVIWILIAARSWQWDVVARNKDNFSFISFNAGTVKEYTVTWIICILPPWRVTELVMERCGNLRSAQGAFGPLSRLRLGGYCPGRACQRYDINFKNNWSYLDFRSP